MIKWSNIVRVIILIIGSIIIAFDARLYILCNQQRNEISTMGDQYKAETQVSGNKFKYYQDQIAGISKDLENTRQQIKVLKDALASQNDALLQEVEKRNLVENAGKNIQISMVDIKAEADAIKEEVKGWQKDYVSILAQLESKIGEIQGQITSLETNLVSLNIPEIKKRIKSLEAGIEKLPDSNQSK